MAAVLALGIVGAGQGAALAGEGRPMLWGQRVEALERRAVRHIAVPEATDRLAAVLPELVAGHVRSFYAEDYHSRRARLGRILRILTTEAARVAANGSKAPITSRRRARRGREHRPRVILTAV
jgi:hypothetical protein